MNINSLNEKLLKIKNDLKQEDKKLKQTSKIISEYNFDDPKDKYEAELNYYSYLNNYEKQYHQNNNEYKKLISKFSLAYLEMSDWYVGPELPRVEKTTFLDSKNDINLLYFMFFMSLFLKK